MITSPAHDPPDQGEFYTHIHTSKVGKMLFLPHFRSNFILVYSFYVSLILIELSKKKQVSVKNHKGDLVIV